MLMGVVLGLSKDEAEIVQSGALGDIVASSIASTLGAVEAALPSLIENSRSIAVRAVKTVQGGDAARRAAKPTSFPSRQV